VVSLARQYKPDAITLDIGLGDRSGWSVLDQLQKAPETRSIPVHVISVVENGQERSASHGAAGYLDKPASKEALEGVFKNVRTAVAEGARRVLVVEDDPVQRQYIVDEIANGEIDTVAVDSGRAALAALQRDRFDCIVVDLGLADMTGFRLIDQIRNDPRQRGVAVVVYTARDLTQKDRARLSRAASSVIMKEGASAEHLRQEVTRFLRASRPGGVQDPAVGDGAAAAPVASEPATNGSHRPSILIVDDDSRNIFALQSLLEQRGMRVVTADSGPAAIEVLKSGTAVDVALVDVMMPDVDGYETIRQIRAMPQLESLPIIAVTAKAMQGDRERCLEAGASDYIAKPIDSGQLMAMLRVWAER
jgi:CheY-like chemotaxis protein